jgi:hypothetical protein
MLKSFGGLLMFELGKVVATRGAISTGVDLLQLVQRHAIGDWGDLCDEDKQANKDALKVGTRLLSKYEIDGHSFYVITEYDRSSTTVLLTDEY